MEIGFTNVSDEVREILDRPLFTPFLIIASIIGDLAMTIQAIG